MDRDPAEARFCAECKRCHSAEEGDLWAESSMLGLRITYFACMDGKVYDITGGYQIVVSFARIIINPLPGGFGGPPQCSHVTCCHSAVFQSGQAARG